MAMVQGSTIGPGTTGSSVGAAVDIGSYSVHLLVAEVGEHDLRARHDESAFLGLGQAIEVDGRLGAAGALLLETLAGFAARATAFGAGPITIVGTDPLRRAIDGAEVIAAISASTGLDVTILSHEEEAFLALLGAQEGRRLSRETVMVDVGGGSTEILLAGPSTPPVAMGLPLGAARLTGVHVAHDPPTETELLALQSDVTATLEFAPPFAPDQLLAVGGTARSLLRIGPPLANRVLTQSRINNALDLIAAEPAATIAERHGVRLSRARVLAAGATILVGALDRYRLDRLRVGTGGLREGIILAAHHAGDAWRAELPVLARGWADPD
jgi:exopolyphosphatase/guanosine-5'-triphosphate,3'-diphosphate pyrophosphatase